MDSLILISSVSRVGEISPVLLANVHVLNVHAFYKPPSITVTIRAEQQVIATHHALTHLPRCSVKGPIFQTVASLPPHAIFGVLELVPELNSDAIIGE
jgi:hypothetical protein